MWKNDNAIVKQAVRLLHEMSLGYSAAKVGCPCAVGLEVPFIESDEFI